jgi:NADPH-dependent 2,4-dienoyl-CoA reductase/sulfur reductase-like enzyme
MSTADIRYLVGCFAAAAERARRAGVDGIEVHAGHGYIISSFLSPHSNHRDDAYGGSLENRARLLLEIIAAIRAAVGPDFPLWCKLDAQEFEQPEGINLEAAQQTARMAQAAGVDAIAVSAYHDNSRGVLHSASHTPDRAGLLLDHAAAIRAVLEIPVIAAGRIEPEEGERRIRAGHCDFIAMGRKLLADPYLPHKLGSGSTAAVRPCIYCYTCISETYLNRAVKCAVKPELGFERELAIGVAAVRKRVAVIGGGPAGMEAARRLALRGHAVTLIERADQLGGSLRFAALAYAANEGILRWLQRELKRSTVALRLGTVADAALLRRLRIDEVVVATGALRSPPSLPGVERRQVFSGDALRQLLSGRELQSLRDKTSPLQRLALAASRGSGALGHIGLLRSATRIWMPLGRRVVIVGGELVGLELAEFLLHRGRQVTVLESSGQLGAGVPVVRRWRLLAALRDAGAGLISHAAEIAIDERGVRYRNRYRQWRTLAADQVILASGARGDLTLAEQLAAQGFKVHVAGDCQGVGYIAGAMQDAARVALRI